MRYRLGSTERQVLRALAKREHEDGDHECVATPLTIANAIHGTDHSRAEYESIRRAVDNLRDKGWATTRPVRAVWITEDGAQRLVQTSDDHEEQA